MSQLKLARSVLLLLTLIGLAGCASTPIVYPDVTPPLADGLTHGPGDAAHGPVIALVLGGGASRGFAHVGAIEELERNGILPSVVVGTSAGSFVGALYAGGYSGGALQYIADGMSEDELRDLVLPNRGFVRGERLQDFVNRYLDDRSIEALPRRFAAVATDLRTGDAVAFNRGNTGMAVRASSSIPGVFQPVRIRGRDYVDGGLVSPVPVRTARNMGADIVIAVDVARHPEHAAKLDTIAEILVQSLAIMGRYVGQDERAEADVLIEPEVNEIGTFDFERRRMAMQAGGQATRGAIPAIRAAIAKAAERAAK